MLARVLPDRYLEPARLGGEADAEVSGNVSAISIVSTGAKTGARAARSSATSCWMSDRNGMDAHTN
jgi:hypothetical protein